MAIGIGEEGKVKVTPEYLIEFMKPPFLSIDDDDIVTSHQDEEQVVSSEQVEKEPLTFPNLRFQCCWARYNVLKLSESRVKRNQNKKCSLYGYIAVSDYNVSQEEQGWLPVDQPHHGYTLVFDREWHDPLPVNNDSFIPSITNPRTNSSVSLGSSDYLNIITDLCAFDEEDNECFRLASSNLVFNFSQPNSIDSYFTHIFKGKDGYVDLSFIVLSDAVDAHLEVTFKKTTPDASIVCKNPVHLQLIAYYGDDFVSAPARIVQKTRGGRVPITPIENAHYCVSLFESEAVTLVHNKKLELRNTLLAVPAKASLVVEAYIVDFKSQKTFMDDGFRIPAKQQGSNFQRIDGIGCELEVNVIWKYKVDS